MRRKKPAAPGLIVAVGDPERGVHTVSRSNTDYGEGSERGMAESSRRPRGTLVQPDGKLTGPAARRRMGKITSGLWETGRAEITQPYAIFVVFPVRLT